MGKIYKNGKIYGGSDGVEVVSELPTGSDVEDKVYHYKSSYAYPTINVHLYADSSGTASRNSELVMNRMASEIYNQSNGEIEPDMANMMYDSDRIAGALIFTYVGSDDPPLFHGKRAKYIVYWHQWNGSAIVTDDEPRRFRYFEEYTNPSTDTPYYEEYVYGDNIPMDEKLSATYDMVFDTIPISDLYVGDSQDEEITKLATEDDISELQSNFQAGVDSIYDALSAKGSTPSSKSLSDVVSAINAIKPKILISGGTTGATSHTFTNIKNGDYILFIHYQYNKNVTVSGVPSTLTLAREFANPTYVNAAVYKANADISSNLTLTTTNATFALHIKI